MRFKKKSLAAVLSCAVMFAAAPLLPAELSLMASAYAKGGNGGNGGSGGNGGGAGGHGGAGASGASGHSGEGVGHAAAGHSASVKGNGLAEGQETDHDGKATRDHGVKGNHLGRAHKSDRGHGIATSSVAHDKSTRGLAKATAISDTTPGDHNDKGLGQAASSTTK